MLKPGLKNILLFIFLKYLLFYIFMMFKNDNYTLVQIWKLKTFGDWIYYLYIFLSLPALYCTIFIIILHFALNSNKLLVFIPVVLAVFGLEYLIYTELASPSDYFNGLYNALIGAAVLWLFFHKSISSKAKIFPTNS